MKTRKLMKVMAVLFTAVCVNAAERTWNGGGSDSNWSTPGNWVENVVPTTDDMLYMGGTVKLENNNDLAEGIQFAGLTFKSSAGAFKLGGSRILLAGNVTNFSASTQTINLPVELPGTCDLNASSGAITINGVLSGAGGLKKTGSKTLTLAASNSYDGVTLVSSGVLSITHANALGSTNGNTEVTGLSGGCIQISGNITVAEPLKIFGERPSNASIFYNASGSNTWSGLITRSGQNRIHGAAGSTLTIAGGVAGSNASKLCVLNSPGTIAFYEKPLVMGNDQFYIESNGTTIIGVAGNLWTRTRVLGGNSTLRYDIADAQPATASLEIGSSAAMSATVNLNGFDQTASKLVNIAPSTGIQIITTPTPATLTLNQNENTTFDGRLTGELSLTKTGTGVLTLSNSLSTTTGNITVTNGTLVAASVNSLGNSTNITVSGGTLELRSSSCIADAAVLFITNVNAQVKIGAGHMETVDMLFLDGVQQMSGTWGATGSGAVHIDDTHFAGSGKLYVQSSPAVAAVNATWDGGGGVDTLMSTANNWEGDVLPTFDGTTYAIFGTGGTVATADTAVNLYGMAFNSAESFSLDNGGGMVTLGMGGIAAATPDTTSRTYTMAGEITLAENSTWDIAKNGTGAANLNITGSVGDGDGLDPRGFTKTGDGVLTLFGSNSYDGVTVVDNGKVTLKHDSALGSTNGNTVINGPSGGCVELSGDLVVAEPLVLNGERVNPVSTGGLWSLYSSGSNTLSGPIIRQGLQTRIELANDSWLIVRGGVIGGNFQCVFTVRTNTSGIAFYDKPVNIGSNALYLEMSNYALAVIGVAENTWGTTRLTGKGILRLDVANALPATTLIYFGYMAHTSDFTVDLNGFDQTIGQIYDNPAAGGARIITSPTPATLTINLDQPANLFTGQFNGALGLTKTGSGTLTLSNSLSTTTGNITVSNGTLVVAKDNALGNSTNITVNGAAARLELRASACISDAATLNLSNDGAKVSLAAGVNEAVGWLYQDEKMMRAGTYGSTSSAAAYKDDTHFAGSGILTVLHDRSGTIIILR